MGSPLIGAPAAKPASEQQLIWQAIAQLEANQKQIEQVINNLIRRVDGIDAVAFASLMLHDGKEFKLTVEAVLATQKAIKAVGEEMNRYRAQRAKEREAAQPANKGAHLLVPKKRKTTILAKGAKVNEGDGRTDAAKG